MRPARGIYRSDDIRSRAQLATVGSRVSILISALNVDYMVRVVLRAS